LQDVPAWKIAMKSMAVYGDISTITLVDEFEFFLRYDDEPCGFDIIQWFSTNQAFDVIRKIIAFFEGEQDIFIEYRLRTEDEENWDSGPRPGDTILLPLKTNSNTWPLSKAILTSQNCPECGSPLLPLISSTGEYIFYCPSTPEITDDA
jgi:hypothetical protein